MKHVADISAEGRHVSRTFRLPLVSEFENAATLTVPPMPTAWHKLPERFLDGLDFASRFVGRRHSSLQEWVWRAHYYNGKVYATDGETLVEYDAGPCDAPYLSHGKREVALLKSFGPPLESAVEKDAGGCAFIHYKWDGNRLRLRTHDGENPAGKLLTMLDAFD